MSESKDKGISDTSIIEEGCVIGENVVIEDFVVLKAGTVIGDNCVIHAGAKIGVPPFSLTKEKGKLHRSLGNKVTILESDVDIGFNTVIQRGIDMDTIIGSNTFINNNCSIGHDVIIGRRCVIGLSTEISGHVKIDDETDIAPGVTILNRVKIGKKSHAGIGSLVLKDVPDSTTVIGRPAVEIERYKLERKKFREFMGLNGQIERIATRKGKIRRYKKKIIDKLKTSLHRFL